MIRLSPGAGLSVIFGAASVALLKSFRCEMMEVHHEKIKRKDSFHAGRQDCPCPVGDAVPPGDDKKFFSRGHLGRRNTG